VFQAISEDSVAGNKVQEDHGREFFGVSFFCVRLKLPLPDRVQRRIVQFAGAMVSTSPLSEIFIGVLISNVSFRLGSGEGRV
jgi:hypothetical protein